MPLTLTATPPPSYPHPPGTRLTVGVAPLTPLSYRRLRRHAATLQERGWSDPEIRL